MNDTELLEAIDAGEAQDWEFKSAKGGVPASMFETYSAMANSRGGVIVLGVEEDYGRFYLTKGLEDAPKKRQDIWNAVNNRGKVSANILTDSDVSLKEIEGCTILVMRVPKAGRRQRPVFIGQNPLDGTFRRNNEGDYHCSRDEVGRMLADQGEETPDLRILEDFVWDDLDEESINQYRQRFSSVRPTHDWLSRDNKILMEKLQGWRTDRATGITGPTVAGLVMFGKWEAIRDADALPQFHVDYREILSDDPRLRWTDRLVPDGTWTANLFQFYQTVITRAVRDLKTPFIMRDLTRIDDTPIHEAIREALTNALIHADYRGQGGIVIVRRPYGFEMSNPGSLLVSIEQMRRGGVSECRNKALQFMFQMMGRGDKGGTGIDTILKGWRAEHWQSPSVEETVEPDRVTLRLPMLSFFPDENIARLRDRFGDRLNDLAHVAMQALVTADIEGEVSNQRLQLMSDSHPVELTKTLQNLVTGSFLAPQGHGRGKTYRLSPIPADVGSKSLSVGSGESNVGSRFPHDGSDVGSKSRQVAPAISAEETKRLHRIAYPTGRERGLGKTEMRRAILHVTADRFLTTSQLGQILKRVPDGLRDRYLTPMVREGVLLTLYPHSPHHSQQAYCAAQTVFDTDDEDTPRTDAEAPL